MCQTVIFLLSIFFFALCDCFFCIVLDWIALWAVLLSLVLTIVFFVIAQMVWASLARKTKPNMQYKKIQQASDAQREKGRQCPGAGGAEVCAAY